MAHLSLSSAPSLVVKGFTLSPVNAGEAITAGMAVYIKSDGLIYKSGSAIVDDANHPMFDGIVLTTVSASAPSQPVTVFGLGSRINLGSSLTIGTRYYSGSVAGLLSDTKLGSADTVIAKAVSSTDVVIVRGEY